MRHMYKIAVLQLSLLQLRKIVYNLQKTRRDKSIFAIFTQAASESYVYIKRLRHLLNSPSSLPAYGTS